MRPLRLRCPHLAPPATRSAILSRVGGNSEDLQVSCSPGGKFSRTGWTAASPTFGHTRMTWPASCHDGLTHPHSQAWPQEVGRKLRFHIFNFQIWKEVSHESFVFTSSTFTFWRKGRTKCAFESARNAVFCRTRRVSEDVCRATGARQSRLWDHARIGPALELTVTSINHKFAGEIRFLLSIHQLVN